MTIKNKTGFTLIELLVVIAIIGILATIGVVAYSSANNKARDAQRRGNIIQIQKALDLYYADNGVYPASGGAAAPNGGWTNSNDASWATLQTALAPYIGTLPKDPTNDAAGWAGTGSFVFNYFSLGYGCNQGWYMILYKLENMANIVSPGVTACDGTVFNYAGTITVGKKGE